MAARRVVRGKCFDLHYSSKGEAGQLRLARLGLIVPKRLARAASLRNAVKRQGREAFRLAVFSASSYDLVLRLKSPLQGLRAADDEQKKLWRAEIEMLLKRLPPQSP